MAWWVGAAISVGTSLMSAGAAGDSARQARKIARLNVEAAKTEATEERRRMALEFKEREGYALALAAASGTSVRKGTSQSRYLDFMKQEHKRQIQFQWRSRVQERNILKAGGQAAYRQAKAGQTAAYGQALGSFAEMYFLGQQQDWGGPG